MADQQSVSPLTESELRSLLSHISALRGVPMYEHLEALLAEQQGDRNVQDRTPTHGDGWVHKQTGYIAGVLMVCGHGDSPTVTGYYHRPDTDNAHFAIPIDDFMRDYLLLYVDPANEAEGQGNEYKALNEEICDLQVEVAKVAELLGLLDEQRERAEVGDQQAEAAALRVTQLAEAIERHQFERGQLNRNSQADAHLDAALAALDAACLRTFSIPAGGNVEAHYWYDKFVKAEAQLADQLRPLVKR